MRGESLSYIGDMRSALVAVLVALLPGCPSSSNADPCGEGGRDFRSGIGTTCAYAVVEGGFLCPPELPDEFEIPGYAGRICAPSGSDPEDIPEGACLHLGAPDCGGARPAGGTVDAGPMTADSGPDVPDSGIGGDSGPPPMCDALDPAMYMGPTPWGTVTADLSGFDAGDCITITGANATVTTAAGDTMSIGFRYPVEGTGEGRRVPAGTYERDATVTWDPVDGPSTSETVRISLVVRRWQEVPSGAGHEIDIDLAIIEDARFSPTMILVRGRFCDWAYLLC